MCVIDYITFNQNVKLLPLKQRSFPSDVTEALWAIGWVLTSSQVVISELNMV